MRFPMSAAVLGCALFALAPAALAAEAAADDPALAKYTRTQSFENCLDTRRIESARILNRRQILFEMTGSDAYLNEPENCPSLSKSVTLAYDATTGQLCTTTIVHLVDTGTGGGERGSCGLAKFQKLEKKPAS